MSGLPQAAIPRRQLDADADRRRRRHRPRAEQRRARRAVLAEVHQRLVERHRRQRLRDEEHLRLLLARLTHT
jgi:hypothetical protein